MKSKSGIGLKDVQAVYGGPEGDLWELVMGQQIHIGGFKSSMDLAEKAGIGAGSAGVDLCCCNGAGMRFLIRFCGVAKGVGTLVAVHPSIRQSPDADAIKYDQNNLPWFQGSCSPWTTRPIGSCTTRDGTAY